MTVSLQQRVRIDSQFSRRGISVIKTCFVKKIPGIYFEDDLHIRQNDLPFVQTANWKIFSGSPLTAGQVGFLAVFAREPERLNNSV
jgi:hypothetical protein